jgi:hypothetical protein
MCLALLISLYHGAMVAEPTSVLALGLFYRVCISGRCGGTVPGSCEDIYRIFFGLVLVWQSIGNLGAGVFDVFHGGSELCRIDRPGVYAKIRKAVIIGNPKSGDIIRLLTQNLISLFFL